MKRLVPLILLVLFGISACATVGSGPRIINTEVLDAESLRTETRRNHDNATYDAVLAVLRLRHATGDLAP